MMGEQRAIGSRVLRYKLPQGVDPGMMTLTFKSGEQIALSSGQCQRELVGGEDWLVCVLPPAPEATP